MSFIGAGAMGAPGLRFATTRGRIQGGATTGLNYPNPFFDLAHTYLPTTVKSLFQWCRYYFMTQPLINATVFKLSEYPVTDIVFDHENEGTRTTWEDYVQNHLRYRAFQVEVGLDYNVYGNALIGISFPFYKYLTCPHCKYQEQARRIRDKWTFTSFHFRLTCPKCGNVGEAQVKDHYVKDASGIQLVRWNPEDVEVTYNDITHQYTYYYNIPGPLRNDITMGKKDVVEQTPQIFIQALKQQRGVIFSKDMLFHMRRPSISHRDRGWGTPLLLPVLKDAFYIQIMKKAQEAVLLEHVVPLRVLFPQAGSGSSDPYMSVNLDQWREHVSQEIARWRQDPNYIPIMPLPLGQETVGGDGKALLLTQEVQMWSEQLLNGLTVPREFIMGGLSYSGSNVSMRMMENMFLGYILYHKQLLDFVIQRIASYLEWPVPKTRFKPFKMADDLQRLSLIMQANTASKVSDTSFLNQLDMSQTEETKIMLQELSTRLAASEKQQLAMADIQGKSQMIMMKYQMKAQMAGQTEGQQPPAPGEPGGPDSLAAGTPGGQEQAAAGEGAPQPMQQQAEGQGGTPQQAQSPLNSGQNGGQPDMQSWAMMQAQQLVQLPPDQQQVALQNLQQQSPELAEMVRQLLAQMGGGQQQQGGAPTDTRPLPEKLPPRRAAQAI